MKELGAFSLEERILRGVLCCSHTLLDPVLWSSRYKLDIRRNRLFHKEVSPWVVFAST